MLAELALLTSEGVELEARLRAGIMRDSFIDPLRASCLPGVMCADAGLVGPIRGKLMLDMVDAGLVGPITGKLMLDMVDVGLVGPIKGKLMLEIPETLERSETAEF